MSGVNRAFIIGSLGGDPELKYLPNGDAVCNFSVATSEEWKDKASGEKKEKAEWHRIVAFRKLGEICGKYLTKGKLVYLEGKLQTRSWEQDGSKRYMTEIVINDMQMLGSKSDSGGGSAAAAGSGGNVPTPEMEDDIPF